MGGRVPPAPANASTQETNKVRYEESVIENVTFGLSAKITEQERGKHWCQFSLK